MWTGPGNGGDVVADDEQPQAPLVHPTVTTNDDQRDRGTDDRVFKDKLAADKREKEKEKEAATVPHSVVADAAASVIKRLKDVAAAKIAAKDKPTQKGQKVAVNQKSKVTATTTPTTTTVTKTVKKKAKTTITEPKSNSKSKSSAKKTKRKAMQSDEREVVSAVPQAALRSRSLKKTSSPAPAAAAAAAATSAKEPEEDDDEGVQQPAPTLAPNAKKVSFLPLLIHLQ